MYFFPVGGSILCFIILCIYKHFSLLSLILIYFLSTLFPSSLTLYQIFHMFFYLLFILFLFVISFFTFKHFKPLFCFHFLLIQFLLSLSLFAFIFIFTLSLFLSQSPVLLPGGIEWELSEEIFVKIGFLVGQHNTKHQALKRGQRKERRKEIRTPFEKLLKNIFILKRTLINQNF